MTMQRTVHDRLRPLVAPSAQPTGSGTASSLGLDASEVDRLVSELQLGLKDVSELYNDFAQPLKVWITLAVFCFIYDPYRLFFPCRYFHSLPFSC